tara:strand:- start:107 stop:1222 length:1116 start_codon:yes stop_codon:yes gene_type:complete
MNPQSFPVGNENDEIPTISGKGIAIALMTSVLLGLVAAEIIVRLAMPQWQEFYSGRFISSLIVPGHGKTAIGRPNFDGHFAQNNGDFRIHLKLNGAGLRNEEPISAANGQLWALGDSMTFGWGVQSNEMYSSVLQQMLKVPVYNIANPGTDICGYQAMAARMSSYARPIAVTVGLVLENDLRKYDCKEESRLAEAQQGKEPKQPTGFLGFSFLDMKLYLTQNLALYNFFAVSLKRVAVINRLLTTVGLVKRTHIVNNRIDRALIPDLANSAADELARLRRNFSDTVPFYVLVIPTRFEIRDNATDFRDMRLAVEAALKRRNIQTVGLLSVFQEAGFTETHFKHDGHWSALGHKLAAKALASTLAEEMQRRR